jgi:predicted dienelactone hydrolase
MTATATTTPILSFKPVTLAAPGRGHDLQLRVSVPATGDHLPVVVFSHGFHQSFDGYLPLADVWAAHGFVVIQPTHLDSLALPPADGEPDFERIAQVRVEDLVRVLDELDEIEATVPGLAGRIDRERIAVAGHSWGGQTASTLLGARVLGADGEPETDFTDARIKAGVLLSTTGTGGDDLSPMAQQLFPFMSPTFAGMTTPALVVAGDHDQSQLSTRGPDWFTDPFALSPGAKSLLTVFGGEHSLGGIPGPGLAEVTDESPERVALVQRVTAAYLRSALGLGDAEWDAVQAELADGASAVGRLESK